jgi:menaquinone-specific isochorismate synthase
MTIHFSLMHVAIDQVRFYYVRLEWFLSQTIPLSLWLQVQTLYPKISWIDRDSNWHMAACHQIWLCHHLPTSIQVTPIRQTTHQTPNGLRSRFRLFGIASTPTSFFLPQYEIHHLTNQYMFALNCIFPTCFPLEGIKQLIKNMSRSCIPNCIPKAHAQVNLLWNIQYSPTLSGWNQCLHQLITQMHGRQIDKLVIARKKILHFQHIVDVFDWLTYKPNCFHFVLIFKPNLALICLSPERLYLRNHSMLMTEAMAATRPRHALQDARWAVHLHSHKKDMMEQNWVKLDLKTKLMCLGKMLSCRQDAIFQTSYLQHLYMPFQVELDGHHLMDHHLIHVIHPTAAICGSPMPQAYLMLQKYERVARGAYACPMGWIGSHDAHLCVSIRCAVIDSNKVMIYAGCGVIAASLPQSEWNETENKFVY